MAEREQHSTHFDAQALGEALGTRPATVHDVAYGEGQLYSAGHGTTRLEVFPRAKVTRLTTQDARVELFGTADAAVSDTGVEFHRSQPDQQASLTVLPGGGVVFTVVAGAEPTPTPPRETTHRPEPVQLPEQGPQTAPEPAREPASPSPLQAASSCRSTQRPADGPCRGSCDRAPNHPADPCRHQA